MLGLISSKTTYSASGRKEVTGRATDLLLFIQMLTGQRNCSTCSVGQVIRSTHSTTTTTKVCEVDEA